MEQDIDLYATPHCEKCGSLPESIVVDGPSVRAVWFDNNGNEHFNYFKPRIWRTLCKYHRMENDKKKG